MAGIGFELRKLLRKQTYAGLLQAYAFAGIISSGPWVLSIVGIMLIGLLSAGAGVASPRVSVSQFQVTVTYLFLISLISTGLVQLSFTRFVADRTFAKDEASILPNFNGLILVVMGVSMLVALPCVAIFFPEQSVLYRLLFVMGLGVMSAIWIATVFLTGMKHYRAIVLMFFLGYSATLGLALLLRGPLGLEGFQIDIELLHPIEQQAQFLVEDEQSRLFASRDGGDGERGGRRRCVGIVEIVGNVAHNVLHTQIDRKLDRLKRRIGGHTQRTQIRHALAVDVFLHARHAAIVDIHVTDNMRGGGATRIETTLLWAEADARNTERQDLALLLRRQLTTKPLEP